MVGLNNVKIIFYKNVETGLLILKFYPYLIRGRSDFGAEMRGGGRAQGGKRVFVFNIF